MAWRTFRVNQIIKQANSSICSATKTLDCYQALKRDCALSEHLHSVRDTQAARNPKYRLSDHTLVLTGTHQRTQQPKSCNNLRSFCICFSLFSLFRVLVLFVNVLADFLYSDYLSFVCMFTCDLSPSTTRVYVCTIHLSFRKVSRCCLICIVIISLLLCNS